MTATCSTCSTQFSYYPSRSLGIYCSRKCAYTSPKWREKQRINKLGRVASAEARAKMSAFRKGRKFSKQHRTNLTIANRNRTLDSYCSGDRHPWWKGGVTVKQKGLRSSRDYRHWRKAVLQRDGYKCILCGSTEQLEVDHIVAFVIVQHDNRLYDTNNGRVLCKPCHVKTDTYARKQSIKEGD